ncbi:zinc finger CCCH domain-containing protein 11A-like [Cygnus olor]|uniref:zinc finger CCCH domain-containing protein 11A-like n=1 Tax=Cygnus olor TaxID=8869 RepID=UPI001ADE2CEC|nr:zinc finger CCCH domain-containing protein 11A-like [Cygnus olor]
MSQAPTHPPVVLNAADDDEDDDDQLFEEGEESKTPVQQPAEEGQNGLRMISTRKASATTAKQEDGLNFGIKTLEEIKWQKMKEKTKRHGEGPSRSSPPPVDSMIFPAPDKENVRTVVRTVTLSTEEGEEPVIRLDLAEKQGKRKASVADVSALPVKRSLAERLGKKAEVPGNADKAPKRVQVAKSVKERLGLPFQQTSTAKGKAAKPKGEIHVKTLEEIRRERALQRRETQAKAHAEWHDKTEDPSAGARPAPAGRVKTFSEALAEKKKNGLVEEKKKAGEFHPKIKIQGEPKKQSVLTLSRPGKVQSKEPAGKVKAEGEVRVKTLEEIKREKALRMQQCGGNVPAPPARPGPAPAGQKWLRNTKLTGNEML